jgi:hypothetical protein
MCGRNDKFGGEAASILCGLGDRSDLNLIAEVLNPGGQTVEQFERIEFVEEVPAKFAIGGFQLEHVIDGDGLRMGHSKEGPLFCRAGLQCAGIESRSNSLSCARHHERLPARRERLPLRVLPLLRLPALSFWPGHTPIQEAK